MDFRDTPTTKATERIMEQIAPHLKTGGSGNDLSTFHYNRVYEIVHRELLANVLVARLPGAR